MRAHVVHAPARPRWLARFQPSTSSAGGRGAARAHANRAFAHCSTHALHTDTATRAPQAIVDGVAAGRPRAGIDIVHGVTDVVEAHRRTEVDAASGKLVVLVD